METPDVIGWTLEEAEHLLQMLQLQYTIEITRPTKEFFPVDEHCLYVVKQQVREIGSISLTVAAKQRREVS